MHKIFHLPSINIACNPKHHLLNASLSNLFYLISPLTYRPHLRRIHTFPSPPRPKTGRTRIPSLRMPRPSGPKPQGGLEDRSKGGRNARGRGGGSKRGDDGATGREVTVSKAMSYLLRHGAEKEGVKIDEGGWVRVEDLVSQ